MRHMLHKAICWYLRRCGGAFHCYSYGHTGRYVVLMNELKYQEHMSRSLAKENVDESVAKAFNKRFPEVPVDDALGWFANALMRGFDESQSRSGKRDE